VIVTDALPEENAHSHQGYDNINIGDKALSQIPIETWSNADQSVRSYLALGPNSTLIQGLANNSYISGERAEIGLCFGSRSELNSSPGNLVFGGYDEGCVANNASFVEYNMFAVNSSSPCPLQVHISDVILTYQNGSQYSIMAEIQESVPACIDPFQNVFTFTQPMYDRWANLTHHPAPMEGSPPYTDQTFPPEAEKYMQDLTIKLEGGYSVTIPHYELVSQERGSDSSGAYAVINSSRIMAAISSQAIMQLPVLGGVFLSQTYLRVNYDRQVFQLAPAFTNQNRIRDIKSTCPATPPHGLSAGGIAGAVIGSLVGGAIVFGLIFFYFIEKVRRARRNDSEPEPSVNHSNGQPDPPQGPGNEIQLSQLEIQHGHENPPNIVNEAPPMSPTELDPDPNGSVDSSGQRN
jgi:hypothetical protein